jgi:hypothetical protein
VAEREGGHVVLEEMIGGRDSCLRKAGLMVVEPNGSVVGIERRRTEARWMTPSSRLVGLNLCLSRLVVRSGSGDRRRGPPPNCITWSKEGSWKSSDWGWLSKTRSSNVSELPS